MEDVPGYIAVQSNEYQEKQHKDNQIGHLICDA